MLGGGRGSALAGQRPVLSRAHIWGASRSQIARIPPSQTLASEESEIVGVDVLGASLKPYTHPLPLKGQGTLMTGRANQARSDHPVTCRDPQGQGG